MKPPYRHYTVWYAADLPNVVFSMTPDGIYHGEVQYEAKLCDSDGQVINGIYGRSPCKIFPLTSTWRYSSKVCM